MDPCRFPPIAGSCRASIPRVRCSPCSRRSADPRTRPGGSMRRRLPSNLIGERDDERQRFLAHARDRTRAHRPGAVPEREPRVSRRPHGDYRFEGEDGPLDFAGLFGDKETLAICSYMFGPERARPCPMCTNTLGAWEGNAADIGQKISLAVVARSPIERLIAWKRERGWR